MRVLPYWPDERYVELAPKHWSATRARLLVEPGEVAVGGGGEELVGHVHQHAVVAQGVLGERGLQLGGHERRVAGGFEEVVEAGAPLIAGGGLQDEATADAAAEGQQLGGTEA